MKKIYANNLTTLSLGRQGENLARQVVFDIRDLESLYGSGTVEVIHQRPGDAQPYPLAVQRDGTLVTWDVTATDTEMSAATANERYGKCELRYYTGETLAKSQIWRTWVESAMDTPSETAPPEPEQGWVDQIISVGAAAKASADAAKADADRATALAAEVAEKAAQTAQDASDAAKAMDAAQTAQRLADEAQGAAETARTAAETAQAAAEQSATDAAGAKQDAETAQKAAHDAAAAAAKALADIRTLYQEMRTWAQGVIQDVNAAGSAAVQSVQNAGDAQVQRVTDEGTTQTANAKAQADSAAQSAAGAAQSAQEAAESAAVYDTVAADVTKLKQDLYDLAPAGAAIGQLFRVAAVSEDGKYTMEPVDMLDVKVNGESIVQDGVANIPLISANETYGLSKIKSDGSYGIKLHQGFLQTQIATNSNISARGSGYRIISTSNMDYVVKAAMCDGKGPAWTAEEQAAACDRVGAIRSYGDGWILKARWQNSDPITVDFSGCSEFFIAGYINAIGESDLLTNIDSNKICYQFVRNGERNIRILFCNQPIGGIMPLLGKWSSYAGIQGDNLTVYSVGKIGSTKKISDITTFSMSKPEVVTSMDIYVYAR